MSAFEAGDEPVTPRGDGDEPVTPRDENDDVYEEQSMLAPGTAFKRTMSGIDSSSAAVRIQAHHRGKSSRSELENVKATSALVGVVAPQSIMEEMTEEEAAAVKLQALIRGRNSRQKMATIKRQQTEAALRHQEEKRKAEEEKAELANAVQQKSMFNREESRKWCLLEYVLPNKPTRLFIFDVAYRAIKLDKKAFPRLRPWVLVPSGYWRVCFAYVMLFAACADVFLCTAAVGFCREVYQGPINTIISLLFAFEMGLGFMTAYPTKDASLEMRPSYIATRYLRSSFFLHLPGLVPLELGATDPGVRRAWQYVRVLRFFDVWYRHDSFRSVTSTENDGVLDALKYLVFTAVVAHTFSTIFFSLAVVDNSICTVDTATGLLRVDDVDAVYATIEEHNTFDPINALPHEVDGWSDYANLYVYYLYATVAMLLGDAGAAKTRATQVIAIIILFVGNITFSVVFSKIILALQAQTAARDAYASKMLSVNDAMDSQGVPRPLQRRVRRFFEFKYMLMAGLDDPATSYIGELPNAMRVDIMSSLYSHMLNDVPLFQGCSTTVISSLAQQLRTHLILPDEIVIKEGCVGNSMYFIRRGLVRVVVGYKTEKEFFIAGLGSGSYFGEVALVSSSKEVRRGASVVAATVLSLLRLSRNALHEVAENEPALLMHIRHVATNRRRELGEDIRSLGSTAMRASGVAAFGGKLQRKVLARQNTVQLQARKARLTAQNSWSASLAPAALAATLRGGGMRRLDIASARVRPSPAGEELAVDLAGHKSRSPPVDPSRLTDGEASYLPHAPEMAKHVSLVDSTALAQGMSQAISHEATERVVEWVRAEVSKLMHEKLDEKLAQILRGESTGTAS